MAGLGAAGLMGAAGLAAGMASLEAMAAYAGYAGRAREMFEPPMGGFEPGFDPEMAAGFGDGGYGGYARGLGGPGAGFGPGPEEMGMVGRRVFVTNLNFATTWQEVKDHFKSVGNVTYVTLMKVSLLLFVPGTCLPACLPGNLSPASRVLQLTIELSQGVLVG